MPRKITPLDCAIIGLIHDSPLSGYAIRQLLATTALVHSLVGVPMVRPVEERPDLFRYGHFVEAGTSLLLFDWVLGYLFGYRDEPEADTYSVAVAN